MYKIFFLIFLPLIVFAKTSYTYDGFIDKQIAIINQLNADDINDEKVEKLLKLQAELYEKKIEEMLMRKKYYISMEDKYESKIYTLSKIIPINKRRHNKYAVIRDEVLKKSYQILQSQFRMVKDILIKLDKVSFYDFDIYLNNRFAQNQKEISKINNVDFKPILNINDDSKILKVAKKRVKEYYAILEINADILKYLIILERKLYRLNKYYKYGLIKPVLKINNSSFSEDIEPFLAPYHLSLAKLIIMIGAAIFLYLIKKYLLNYLIRMVYKQKRLKHKQKRLIYKIRKPLEHLLILANINLVLYIYNDFSSMKVLTPLFNILYILIVMWSIYRVLNTIADYKIKSIAKNHTTLRSELVNISIKIINFILLILTILFVLSFMGINLTAILSGLGIGGLAIALAAKDSLANFFGTLSILLSDTFSQGDLINVGDIKGTVVEIGLRVTTIRTFDNALISVPNSTLANGAIKNLTKRKIGRRIKMNISLRYDSKKESIKKAIKEIEEMLKNHQDIAKKENVENIMVNKAQAKIVSKEDLLGIKYLILVSLDEFAQDSIDILVYCFTKSVDWESWLNTKSDVMEKIMDILEKNNLEFAYPSLAVYQKGNQS